MKRKPNPVTDSRRRSRDYIGVVPPKRVIPDKRRKPPKHKQVPDEYRY